MMSFFILEKERELLWDRRPYMAEFIGTFFFVMIGILSIIASAALVLLDDGSTRVVVAAAHGGAIALMVSMFGAVSGGHFNPAVTFAVLLRGKIGIMRGLLYVLAQLGGALLAAFLLKASIIDAIVTKLPEFEEYFAALKIGTPTFAEPGLPMYSWFFIEIVLTAVLVTVILRNAIEQEFPAWAAGLTIGGAVFIDVLAGGPFTGAAMNPARAFGPAAVSGHWVNHWVYWAAPFTGAFIGWVVNEVTSRKSDR